MPEVSDHDGEIDEMPVFWRTAPSPREGGSTPLYLHGVPDSSDAWVAPQSHRGRRAAWRRWWRPRRGSDEWVEPPPYEVGFLERSGGVAVDLPGFGRTGKPGYLKFTIAEYDGFLERFLDMLGLERVQLVMHDWGAVGLAFAQRLPQRVERLVLINAVPFLPGYRWHRTARIWRTPGLGELAMGTTTRSLLSALSRETNATPGPMPGAWLDRVLEHFDEGTQRAILRLYRSSPPNTLAAAGLELGELDIPALIVWGTADPYIPASFARDYARALPRGELLELADAGHYPWLDRPALIERVTDFLDAG